MKSSFKKMYESNQQADGSMKLIFKGSRLGVFSLLGGPFSSTFLLLVAYAGCFIGLLFLEVALWDIYFIPGNIGKTALIALAAPLLLLKLFHGGKKNEIHLQPEGIEFNNGKKQIALTDIKNFGVMTQSVSGNSGYFQSAYVYVDALGRRIALTGHMTEELAEAIRTEITSYYNRK